MEKKGNISGYLFFSSNTMKACAHIRTSRTYGNTTNNDAKPLQISSFGNCYFWKLFINLNR